jgi:hypothetical protein
MKRLLILAALLLCACAGGETRAARLAIADGDEEILALTEIAFQEGETVLDVLKRETRARRLHMEYDGVGAAAYVRGIDNRYEFDRGAESGWIYTVNGEEINTGAGVYKPAEGDEIVWRYIISR